MPADCSIAMSVIMGQAYCHGLLYMPLYSLVRLVARYCATALFYVRITYVAFSFTVYISLDAWTECLGAFPECVRISRT